MWQASEVEAINRIHVSAKWIDCRIACDTRPNVQSLLAAFLLFLKSSGS